MRFDIVTIGSATVDVFVKADTEVRKHEHHVDLCYHLGEKLLIEDVFTATGGGGTNTAVAFSRLGLKTGWIGAVGDDLNGKLVLGDLGSEKIEFLGKLKKGKTGFSVILLGKEDRTVLAFKGINNSLNMKDIATSIDSKWIYCSSMMGESKKTQEKIVGSARDKRTRIAANISLYEAKLGIKNLLGFLKNLDILVLNKEEAEALTGKKQMEEILKEIRKAGVGIVVVTDGPNPIYVFDGDEIIIEKVKKVKAINMTGAGDAFAAAFVYGIMNGKDIKTSINYGLKESKAVILGMGAKQGLLRML